jgi:outer membrane protein TolC
MRWSRKIEPLLYEEAKNVFVESMESVSGKAVGRFFDLALAQLNLKIAQINFSNSDTLFKIAQGRYNIGTIAENDVLQMQLSFLNAKTALSKAGIDLELQKNRLRSFLGFNEKMDFELILPVEIPDFQVDFENVLDLALKNNPDVIAWHRRKLETNRDVAQAKGERKNLELDASFGLDHNRADNLSDVYQSPFNDKQQVRVSLRMPLIDWGRGKGRVKMAQSNQELVDVQIQQEQIDFEQNIYLQVTQFNLQREQVHIASITDTIGQKRYDVTKQRFLIGRIDVLNLNDALREKDSAKRGYISALREYWNYYYILRQLTLFDFVNNSPINQDFDTLIESN